MSSLRESLAVCTIFRLWLDAHGALDAHRVDADDEINAGFWADFEAARKDGEVDEHGCIQ